MAPRVRQPAIGLYRLSDPEHSFLQCILVQDLLQRIEDLQEAQDRLEQYEKGIFGLPEAMR